MDGLNFKRTDILTRIISRLDDNSGDHALILVGRSGTSKTNLLQDIICHYFIKGFLVFYNFEQDEIKYDIVNYLRTKLRDGNKMLIAVDNVHDNRTAAIFSVIEDLKSYQEKKDNIRFILAGRRPEFDRFIEDRLHEVPSEQIRASIRKLIKNKDRNGNTSIRFEIPNFTAEEIKDYVKKYKDEEEVREFLRKYKLKYNEYGEDENVLDKVSSSIFKETDGYPILIKFVLFGKGLAEDVNARFFQYLRNAEMKLQTMLICAILDRAGVPITEDLLDKMDIIEYAYELTNETLILIENRWKTIHLKWDLELLAYLYTANDKSTLKRRIDILKKSMQSIFKTVENEGDRYFILSSLYDSTTIETEENKKLPIDIIENIVAKGEKSYVNQLSRELIFRLYNYYIGKSYYHLKQYDKSLSAVKEALAISPDDISAHVNEGISLVGLGRYQEAITCYDEIIEKLDPTNVGAWYNKGNVLVNLARDEGDPCRYQEAITCYDEIIEKLDPTNVGAWYNKGYSLVGLGRYQEAITCYDEIIEKLDPTNVGAWYNKGNALVGLGRYQEAITCYDEIIEKLDPTNIGAWRRKGNAVVTLARYLRVGHYLCLYS